MDILKKRLMKRDKSAGFTLVELLVVIAIIAILSVTAYVALGGQTEKARNSKRQQDLAAIQNALEIFFVENNSNYPLDLDDGDPNNSDNDLVPDYMPKMAMDPSSTDSTPLSYAYATGNNDRKYQLGAVLVDEDGLYTAYILGNGSDLLTAGCTYNKNTGNCDCVTLCPATDGSDTCVPYCI